MRRYQKNHKLRSWMIDEVVAALRDDLVSLSAAARRIKVPPATLRSWIQRGRSGSGTPLEIELASRVDDVLYAVERRLVASVATASKEWYAHFKLLERKFPADYGALASKLAVEEDDEEPPVVTY